jgi:site-specific recombinase XerD
MNSGGDIANVQTLAGHKSIKPTQPYLGVSTELRRQAVDRLTLPEPPAGN